MSAFFWAVLAMLTWGFVPVLEKLGLNKIPVVWVALFYRCIGVLMAISVIVLFKFQVIKQAVINIPQGWYYLVVGGMLASVIGQIFFYKALRLGDVSKIVPLVGAYPLVSFVLGIFLLKEAITMPKAFGVGFIIMGIVLLK